jgi:hypothetical protein
MNQDVDNMLCVVVLESGATWPAWINEYQAVAPNSVVIAQAPEETAEQFGVRAGHRLQEAKAGRTTLRVAVVVTGSSSDAATLAQRHGVCRQLVHAMAGSERADLVLAGDGGGSDQSRHELFALAGALCDELRGSELTVRVRFSEGRPKSGTMRSVLPDASVEEREAGGRKSG